MKEDEIVPHQRDIKKVDKEMIETGDINIVPGDITMTTTTLEDGLVLVHLPEEDQGHHLEGENRQDRHLQVLAQTKVFLLNVSAN